MIRTPVGWLLQWWQFDDKSKVLIEVNKTFGGYTTITLTRAEADELRAMLRWLAKGLPVSASNNTLE